MAWHVYDSKYCKALTIACCDMQSKDGATRSLFWENFHVVMAKNGAPNVNFEGLMGYNAQADWNVVRKIKIWRWKRYGDAYRVLMLG